MQTSPYSRIAIYAAISILAAVIINGILFFLFAAMSIISSELIIPNAEKALSVDMVIMATLIPMVVATLLFMLLVRITKRANLIFLILATAIFLFSLTGPFSIPGVSTAMAVAMNILHIPPALALIIAFRKATAPLTLSRAH